MKLSSSIVDENALVLLETAATISLAPFSNDLSEFLITYGAFFFQLI